MNHPLNEMMTSSMAKIKDMIDVNTVIGDPITTPDGVTLIPITKVSVGYGGGGSDFVTKNYPANRDNAFGGGAGAGVTITPMAFVVIRGESVRMLPIAEPASTSVDRIVEWCQIFLTVWRRCSGSRRTRTARTHDFSHAGKLSRVMKLETNDRSDGGGFARRRPFPDTVPCGADAALAQREKRDSDGRGLRTGAACAECRRTQPYRQHDEDPDGAARLRADGA